jgi:hypothetical protein
MMKFQKKIVFNALLTYDVKCLCCLQHEQQYSTLTAIIGAQLLQIFFFSTAFWNNELPVFCDSVTQNAMNGCIKETTAHSHGIAGGAGTDYQGLPQGLQSTPISTPLTPSSSIRPQLPAPTHTFQIIFPTGRREEKPVL